jgi:hypothetical protein
MTAKHPKLKRPTNVDLVRNPLIGGSKGVTMAQATPDDLDDMQAANTFEGDVENDTNIAGGVEDFEQERSRRRRHERDEGPRRTVLQGKKTHEQQLRMLERKPDVPDSRQIEQELPQMAERGPARRPREGARQSEFAVSRGGVNQESQHNKHNHQSQTGHKPPKTRART